MTSFTAFTTLPGPGPAEALATAMEAMDPAPAGIGCFEIEDGSGLWEVQGYFTAAPDAAQLALLSAGFGARAFAVSELPETDWVAHVQRELAPVEAGRFFLYGSHDAPRVPAGPGRIALLIEASMAFGTGHHGTTRGCLIALDRLAASGFRPARIIDVGCGTAVLAMAAARVWPAAAPVLASDIDPVAIEVAAANLAANRLDGAVRCIVATGLDHPETVAAAPFDLAFANILAAPLVALAPAMGRHLAPGGRVILSGLLCEQADAVLQAYRASGFTPESRDNLGEWATLTLVRGQ
ncbi:MAG: 50S ribosomal protein L11 methyltransferase [Rhodobacteraceae bacterium]|jgi:ribosomal protein L11 methyltransferase|nr:50S ribosomal protein L11 methyltransferase [Paracoccaceae bacterium]